jgi:Rrf2 family protein
MAIKISTKGRYGLRLLVDIALHQDAGVVTLRDISERQDISIKYLWQVINPLKNAGLVQVVRGARGGFVLARTADRITVYDVVSILEGPMALVPCVKTSKCDRVTVCAVREVWCALDQALERSMRGITLGDIVRRIQQPSGSSYDI